MGKKGKKGKKKGSEDLSVKMTEEEIFVAQKATLETLEKTREITRREADSALVEERKLRQKVEEMQADLSTEQKQTFAVVADSARSYKADQEGLIFQINSLETTLVDLREERDTLRHELLELQADKQDQEAELDDQIQVLKKRCDDIAAEFVDMLQTILKLMRERMGQVFTGESQEALSKTEYVEKFAELQAKTMGGIGGKMNLQLGTPGAATAPTKILNESAQP